MKKIVTKFGGSSLADAGQFRKVKDILLLDEARQYVIPSAPGRRFKDDDKVTDLLYRCHKQKSAGEDYQDTFDLIAARYMDIAEELGLHVDLGAALDEVNEKIDAGANADYCASRGEYLNGMLLADFMGWRFMDAAEAVKFTADGAFDAETTNTLMAEKLSDGVPTVVPGFYGSYPDGTIKTFSRGGSDITGAIVARAVEASVYENWTDVSGFLMADPRIVPHPREISSITYKELRELSYMGASVLHEDAMFPVHKAGIPTNIRNTNDPSHPGTIISLNAPDASRRILPLGSYNCRASSLEPMSAMETSTSFERTTVARDCPGNRYSVAVLNSTGSSPAEHMRIKSSSHLRAISAANGSFMSNTGVPRNSSPSTRIFSTRPIGVLLPSKPRVCM